MSTQPAPIAPFVAAGADADWETVRHRLMATLTSLVPTAWSDHNAADPGVTLAETAAFGLADLHYRTAERRQEAWPLEVAAWLPDAERHWEHAFSAESLAGIATSLADPAVSTGVLEAEVRACAAPLDATVLLAREPWADAFTAAQRPIVVALMRGRLVRQVAHEQAHVIAEAVAAERVTGGSVEDRDERAVLELGFTLPLWEDEIRAVVRRERRRLSREALVARIDEVRAVTPATEPALQEYLEVRHDLDPDEVRIALAAGTQPPGLLPEELEVEHGRTEVWPAHPVQSLTCEPVVAEDYARRARAHDEVRRAWAVPGRLDGIAWNGLETGDTEAIAVDPDAAAITLVVERRGPELKPADRLEFLRDVLEVAIGPEVREPFPDWRIPELADEITPRRTLCDEVGVSMLRQAPIVVQGTLVTSIGVDPTALVEDVRARIAAFFDAGRPETRAAEPVGSVDGPWPRIEQPPGGWVPGEPVRFTEVVEAIVANPDVWGVQRLAMKLDGAVDFVPQAAGSLELPGNAVPSLAATRCLRVRFSLAARCGDA